MILSLATTNLIIERCICDYLQSIIISGESLGCPSKPTRESPAIFSQSASVRKAHHAEDFADLASQPCEYGSSPHAPTTREPEARHGVRAEQPIFAALENYIISCFEDIETLNLSFLTRYPSPAPQAGSESPARSTPVTSQASAGIHARSEQVLPNLDAKTILAGDIAENGLWWTGAEGKNDDRPRPPLNVHSRSRSARSASKDPNIHWKELYSWYDSILSIQEKIDETVKQKPSMFSKAGGNSKWAQASSLLSNKQEEINSACSRVRRTLLKATERLLRRPTRPIRSTSQCRFLFIILANPLLLNSDERSISQKSNIKDTSFLHTTPLTAFQRRYLLPAQRSQFRTGRANRNIASTGIIKRVCGLLSNLSTECHQYLVHWFTRTPETFFRQCTEIMSLFLVHRLSRHDDDGQLDKAAESSVLVPELSQTAMGSSAQLHAALGLVGAPRSPQKCEDALWYSSDWQIKSAAKVISLLFAANVNHPARNVPALSATSKITAGERAFSPAAGQGQLHGQLLPIDHFYNSLLDFADLVADYEVWESRKGVFTFCQYPMLLSIWAKIHLMEHDARRQMEIKAREAFFDSIMSRKAISQYLVFKIRRECLVEDSLRNVSEVVGSGQDEIKKGLRIEFLGEEGFDAGGLRKEWFLMLIREVFDPDHGLFIYDDESRYCYFNPHTFETTDQFFLVGVVLGLAIYNSTILDIALPPFAFRKLLASVPTYSSPATTMSRASYSHSLEDLAELRPSLARGLQQLLVFEGDVQKTFCRDFVIEIEQYGQVIQLPLCDNGEEIPVTNENRRKFVDLYVRYVLDVAVTRQYEPFKRGFFSICGGNAITLFRPEEIDLLIRGSGEGLDVATLRAVAVYENWGRGAQYSSIPVIRWFWSIFEDADPGAQRCLLSFITSSDRIPAVGATSLVIKISCLGDDCERYPIARTCFNMLGLYRYSTRARLEEKLWRAVAESEGFALR